MKRRDFLKMSLCAGVAAVVPFNLMSLTGCSDDKSVEDKPGKPDLKGAADLLVFGNIITVDESQMFAEAMTVKNGYIQYVGNLETALKLCDDHTEKIDLKGRTAYPGFMEAHCHGSSAGLVELTIKLFAGNSYADYQRMIRDYIKQNPGKDTYRISGWSIQNRIDPTSQLLDEVTPEGAMIMGSAMDGHSFLANTNFVHKLEKEHPEFFEKYNDQEIIRDPVTKRPTGFFKEAAATEAQRLVPVSPEQAEDSIRLWQQFAYKNGYVAAAEAGVNINPVFVPTYKELAKRKELKLRTRAYWNVVMTEANEAKVDEILQMTKDVNDEYYKIIGLKIFVDGVVESHTALLTEKYCDMDTFGMDRYKDASGDPDATLKNLVLMAHQRGLATHTHTIGDGAVKKMLDAIEYSKNITGNFAIRDMLAHLELVRPEDIKRFAKLNVSAIVSALWSPKGAISSYTDEVALIGDRACKNYQIMNSFVEKGVNCAQHTDYPVSQAVGVPRAIYCGITRQLPDKGKLCNLRPRLHRR